MSEEYEAEMKEVYDQTGLVAQDTVWKLVTSEESDCEHTVWSSQ